MPRASTRRVGKWAANSAIKTWDHFKRHPWHYIYRGLITLFVGLLIFFIGVSLQTAETITHISATTEVVSFVGGQAGSVDIPLVDAEVINPDGSKACLQHAVITPGADSVVRFLRSEDGPLIVQVDPSTDGGISGNLEQNGLDRRISGAFSANILSKACQRSKASADALRTLRFPITGKVMVGREFSNAANGTSYILTSGKIQTFVRALPTIFGIPVPRSEGVIIPAQSVEIPAGARLFECAAPKDRVDWSGFVEARIGGASTEDRSMSVSVMTDAHRLALVTPGGAVSSGINCGEGTGAGAQVDVIGLSVMGRMAADPNALVIPIMLSLTISLIGTLVSIHSLPVRVRK